MPELPEVETVRRGIESFVLGRKVLEVSVTGKRTIRRQSPAEFAAELTGRRLDSARRRGKYLLVGLDDGAVLVCHLRMSGQLLLVKDPALPAAPHTHVRLALDDRSELRFVDQRTFGELWVTDDLDGAGVPRSIGSTGLDPLDDGVDQRSLGRLCSARRTSLKAFLLDQRALAGIGNLYADEICFAARIRPDRRTDSLRPAETKRLAGALVEVLSAAVELRGSTLRDARYLDLMGEAGGYQQHHAVYGREGEPCPRCGRPISRAKLAGRSTFFCAHCQR